MIKVHFNRNVTPTVSSDNINANIYEDDDKVAYFDVSELATIDDEATVTFNVINESNGIAALLSLKITNSNTEYFNVSKDIQKTNLLAGENNNITITVSLKKLPISESVSSSIKLKIKSNPIENEETLYAYGNPDTPGI